MIDGEEATLGQKLGLSQKAVWKLLAALDSVLLAHPHPVDDDTTADPTFGADDMTAAAVAISSDYRQALSGLHAAVPVIRDGTVEHFRPQTLTEFWQQRQSTVIQIIGADRTAQRLTVLLAEAGVGQLWIWDPQIVQSTDIGAGFRPEDLGRMRSVAVAEHVRERVPGTDVYPQTHPVYPTPTGECSILVGRRFFTTQILEQFEEACFVPVELTDDEIIIWPWQSPQHEPFTAFLESAASSESASAETTTDAPIESSLEASFAASTSAAGLVANQVLNWIDSSTLRGQIPLTVNGQVPGQPQHVVKLHLGTGVTSTVAI